MNNLDYRTACIRPHINHTRYVSTHEELQQQKQGEGGEKKKRITKRKVKREGIEEKNRNIES